MYISTEISVLQLLVLLVTYPSAISFSSLPLNIVGGMYEVWTYGSHVKNKNFKGKKKRPRYLTLISPQQT